MAATNLVATEAALAQVRFDGAPQFRQGVRELGQIAVFRLVAAGGPALVIAVLLAAPHIAPGNLHVTVGVRRDPDIRPGRRNDQRLDPVEVLASFKCLAFGCLVVEPLPRVDAADAGSSSLHQRSAAASADAAMACPVCAAVCRVEHVR